MRAWKSNPYISITWSLVVSQVSYSLLEIDQLLINCHLTPAHPSQLIFLETTISLVRTGIHHEGPSLVPCGDVLHM